MQQAKQLAGCPLPAGWAKMGGSHLQRPQVPEVPQPFQRLGPGKGHGEGATHTALDCSLVDMHSPCLPDRSWCELERASR